MCWVLLFNSKYCYSFNVDAQNLDTHLTDFQIQFLLGICQSQLFRNKDITTMQLDNSFYFVFLRFGMFFTCMRYFKINKKKKRQYGW